MVGDGIEAAHHPGENGFDFFSVRCHEGDTAGSLDEIPVSGGAVHTDEIRLHVYLLRLDAVPQALVDDGDLRAGVDDCIVLLARKPEGNQRHLRLAETERNGLSLHTISQGHQSNRSSQP